MLGRYQHRRKSIKNRSEIKVFFRIRFETDFSWIGVYFLMILGASIVEKSIKNRLRFPFNFVWNDIYPIFKAFQEWIRRFSRNFGRSSFSTSSVLWDPEISWSNTSRNDFGIVLYFKVILQIQSQTHLFGEHGHVH